MLPILRNWLEKIRTRLFLSILLISIAGLSVITIGFYWQFKRALEERILLQLSSIRHLKQYQVENFLQYSWEHFETAIMEGVTSNMTVDPDSAFFLEHFAEIPFGVDTEGVHDWTPYTDDTKLCLGLIRKVGDRVFLKLLRDAEITHILLERTGMGKSGETYLAGMEGRLRSASRFFPDSSYYEIRCNTFGFSQALSGNAGSAIYKDYRNVLVLGSYDMIDFLGVSWVIISEIDQEEAFEPLHELQIGMLIIFLLIILAVVVVSLWLSKVMVEPIHRVRQILTEMSKGKNVNPVDTRMKSVEFQQMIEALNRLIQSMNQVVQFAHGIGSGNFELNYNLMGPEDTLGRALIQMRDDLVRFQNNEELYKRNVQRSLLEGQENERNRLSRDLHDGLGPLLTSLRMNLAMAKLDHAEKEALKQQIDETIAEVRRLSSDIMPQSLIDFGVGIALGSWLESLKKVSRTEIVFKNDLLEESKLTPQVHIGLYRIAQESINNALKHSNATQIKVSLTEFEDKVSYFMSDNGRGFDVDQTAKGRGLVNMKERVRLLNGSFYIDSSSEGTTIEVELPV